MSLVRRIHDQCHCFSDESGSLSSTATASLPPPSWRGSTPILVFQSPRHRAGHAGWCGGVRDRPVPRSPRPDLDHQHASWRIRRASGIGCPIPATADTRHRRVRLRPAVQQLGSAVTKEGVVPVVVSRRDQRDRQPTRRRTRSWWWPSTPEYCPCLTKGSLNERRTPTT